MCFVYAFFFLSDRVKPFLQSEDIWAVFERQAVPNLSPTHSQFPVTLEELLEGWCPKLSKAFVNSRIFYKVQQVLQMLARLDQPTSRLMVFLVLALSHTRQELGECGQFALLHARSRRSSSPRPLRHAWHDQAEEDWPSQGRGEAN